MLNHVKIHKIPIIFFRQKKKKENCKNLGVGQDLTKFVKIPMLESLRFFYFYFLKNKGILT